MNPLYLLILIIPLLFSCDSDKDSTDDTVPNNTIVLKGERQIGLDLLNLSETNSFENNLDIASQLGIEYIALHLPWTSIETTPNTYSDPDNALELLSDVAVQNNLKFSLTIRPIDLTGKTVPVDLENVSFNDPLILNRFKELIDFIFTKVEPSILLNLQIGNEIDGYNTSLEADTFWEDYGVFLNSITQYVHTLYPSLPIGFTGTFNGLMENPNRFETLLNNVDILGVTYYPINSDFSVKGPAVIFDDLDALTAQFDQSPIYLQEVGYQTSEVNNSNQSKQAAFYTNFFEAWDSHNEAIKTANLVRLNDLSIQNATESAVPYDIENIEFIEYLRTLGLRAYNGDGNNKDALTIIKDHLAERGW